MRSITIFAVLVAGLCFAKTTGTITVTIPSDVVTAIQHAHDGQYAENEQYAKRVKQTLTEDQNPTTLQGMIAADLATAIADKVVRFSPSDLPARNPGETDIGLRNRYQDQIKRKVIVK